MIPEGYVEILMRIKNRYKLHEDVTTYARAVAPVPPADKSSDEYDTWLHTYIIPLTGVGHTDGDSWYDISVYRSSDESVIPVGTTWDWGY